MHRLLVLSRATVIGYASFWLVNGGPASAWSPSFDVGPVHINPLSPIPITPKGTPDPVDDAAKAAQKKAEEAAKAAADAAKKAADTLAAAVQANVEAEAALAKAGVAVVTGGENLSDAVKGVLISKGKAFEASAEAASAASEQTNNVKVAIGQAVAGDTGKTVLTLATGLDRLQVEFGTTAAIQASHIAQGKDPAMLIAAPLAAALRAAHDQFEPQSQSIPADIRQRFSGQYPDDVLNQARFAIGGLSISAPDIANGTRRIISSSDNATTVGNVIVFSTNPTSNFHWWAHELRHVQQYSEWGIDKFAYNYLTSCHFVESQAEDKAREVVPITGSVDLGC